MKNALLLTPLGFAVALALAGCAQQSQQPQSQQPQSQQPQSQQPQSQQQAPTPAKRWLAGDHHIHTHYSVKWDNSVFPPKPIIGGDAK